MVNSIENMLNDMEKTILRKLSETHLATKSELKKTLLKTHSNVDIDAVTKSLLER